MKLLLTGGTGFLGKRVLNALLQTNVVKNVVMVSRAGAPHADARVTPFKADLTQAASLKELEGPFDAVIHLAGLYDFNASYAENHLANVTATEHLLKWAEGKTKRFLYASTFAIHDVNQAGVIREERIRRLPSREIPYSYTKALAEELLYSTQFDLEIFRLGSLIADGESDSNFVPEKIDGPYLLMRLLSYPNTALAFLRQAYPFARSLLNGVPLFVPVPATRDAHLPLVPVTVAANVIVKALLKPDSGGLSQKIYHVLHPESARCEDFVNAICNRFIPGSKLVYLPQILKAFDHVPLGKFNDLKPLLRFGQFKGKLSTEKFEARFGKNLVPTFASYVERFMDGFKEFNNPKQPNEPVRCAFIVHPLSDRDLFRHPFLNWLEKAPPSARELVKTGLAKTPIQYYGTLKGAKSTYNGVEVICDLYVLLANPKQIMNMDEETLYAKLTEAAVMAEKNGAKIMGLGAYTKVAGDAGLTVSQTSPIPITNGNSYSASTTLWAARLMLEKLDLADPDNLKAVVIGATGSIGRVSSLLIASKVKELVLVSTKLDKLEEVRAEILEEYPDLNVKITTDANTEVGDADLIVTATSNLSGSVIDIMKVKPGAVICDCSRPQDISRTEAAKRPDVMVIDSGEVKLPGQIKMNCDIGLPKGTVYACLAETVLLAMEDRFESFSLSKQLSTGKVKEIYQLGMKHGAKLAEITGPRGLITEETIQACRMAALESYKNLNDESSFVTFMAHEKKTYSQLERQP